MREGSSNLPALRPTNLSIHGLILVPFERQDVELLHDLWVDPHVRRYLWDDAIISIEKAREVVESHFAIFLALNIGYWSMILEPQSDERRVEGFVGFRPIDGGPEIELMYGLRKPWWGKGIATGASRAVIEYFWQRTNYQRLLAINGCWRGPTRQTSSRWR